MRRVPGVGGRIKLVVPGAHKGSFVKLTGFADLAAGGDVFDAVAQTPLLIGAMAQDKIRRKRRADPDRNAGS